MIAKRPQDMTDGELQLALNRGWRWRAKRAARQPQAAGALPQPMTPPAQEGRLPTLRLADLDGPAERPPDQEAGRDGGDWPREDPPSPNGVNGGGEPPGVDGEAPKPEARSDGRDAAGRFVKGCKGGPGNPYVRQIAKLRSALVGAVTEDDVRAITRRLVDNAKNGDLKATRLLFSWVLGQPPEAINPDRVDTDELDLLASGPTAEQLLGLLLERLPPEQAAAALRDNPLAARRLLGAVDAVAGPEQAQPQEGCLTCPTN